MFVTYSCIENGSNAQTCEIATFYGIRYNRNGFAVLSTEHKNHDYLMPMTHGGYLELQEKITKIIRNGSGGISITGAPVFRVRRGAILPMDDTFSAHYSAVCM